MNNPRLRKYYKTNAMTNTIFVVLVAMFIIETLRGGSDESAVLFKLGAQFNPAIIILGQWWRLFTAQFLHIGLLHLVVNCVTLFYIGQYLEPMLGHVRFLIIYLLAGVGGNLMTLALGSDNAVSAGASTALFGLFGAMIALGIANRTHEGMAYLGRQSFVLAVINLLFDINIPQIDTWGHVGGLLAGFLLTVILGDQNLRGYKLPIKILAGFALIGFVLISLRLGFIISE